MENGMQNRVSCVAVVTQLELSACWLQKHNWESWGEQLVICVNILHQTHPASHLVFLVRWKGRHKGLQVSGVSLSSKKEPFPCSAPLTPVWSHKSVLSSPALPHFADLKNMWLCLFSITGRSSFPSLATFPSQGYWTLPQCSSWFISLWLLL